MMRRRASIKGIGASIFYDVDDPVFNPKVREVKPVKSLPEDSVSELDDEFTEIADEESYDTGDLIALWEKRAEDNGVSKKTFITEMPSNAELERLFSQIKTEVPGSDSFASECGDEPAPDISLSEVSSAGKPPIAYEPFEESDNEAEKEVIRRHPERAGQLAGEQPVNVSIPLGDLKTVSPEQEQRAWKRLGEQPFENLVQEIGALYNRTVESLSTHAELAQRSMDLLSEARDLLLLGNAGDFNLAERRVNEVKITLNRIEQTRRWANTYGWGLFLYELILFIVFVMALLFDQHIAEWVSLVAGTYSVTQGISELARSMSSIFPPWNTMLWGGIGGVVGALYSLHWHVSELQDFDKQYSLWYVVQPLMGLILGGIIHLVIITGLLALIPVSASGIEPAVTVQWFPALVACLAGFRQKFTYELLDSVMKAIGRQPTVLAKA